MIGQVINGRYRLEGELGRGGMGVVYRAHDSLLDRPVAVKMLSQSRLGTEGRARLLMEAQAAAQLNHPHIIGIYDAGETDTIPFIVMELVDGPSLHDCRPQSLDEILAIATQVCSALEHAHAHKIIHRDLKPENILLAQDVAFSESRTPCIGTVKLTDFGLARSLASRITHDIPIVGTVFYIAPELALAQPYDQRSDLYSFGVVLFELCAGRLPFFGDDPLAVISQHLYAPVVPPHTFRPDIPLELETIILRLLEKKPQARFSQASELRLALEAVQKNLSSGIKPLTIQADEGTSTVVLLELLARGRLVGRRPELTQLRDLWERARQGHAHLALISGEPGIGKTRLVNELIVYARLGGASVLRGGCYEYEASTPYLPIVEAIRDWVDKQETPILVKQLDQQASELARLAPEIETRIGPLPASPVLSPNEERLRLFDSVARYLQRLAQTNSVMLFIDDLHWADLGTLNLVHYILRNLQSERLLILGAYREGELDRSHPLSAALVDWNRDRLATRLQLGRFSESEVNALLSALFGEETISAEFTSAVFRETEGNPFFIEEVIKSLIEQGQIYRVETHWERGEVPDLAIPQSVKEAISRRLNRQSPGCLEVLHTAAVLGKRFDFTDLAVAVPQSESELLDALDEAVATQLIQELEGDAYTFSHDKIREVLYEELNPIRRRRLHQRVGEALERLYIGEKFKQSPISQLPPSLRAHAADLAHHFIHSGDLLRGLDYSLAAATNAESLFEHTLALSHYRHALDCAESLNLVDRQAEILFSMALNYYHHGLLQSALEYYQKALALTEDGRRRAEIMTRIGAAFCMIGDEQGMDYLQSAIHTLDPLTQVNDLAYATALIGRFHHYRADWERAIEYLERARLMAEPLNDAPILTEIYGYLSGAYQQSNQWEKSNEWALRSIELGKRLDHLPAEAMGYEFLGENAYSIGLYRQSLEYAQRDQELGEKIGSLSRRAWAHSCRAHALSGLGDLESAINEANLALNLAEHAGEQRLIVLVRSTRANINLDRGNDEAALEDLHFIMERAMETGQRQMLNWAMHTQINYFLAREEWQAALIEVDRFEELVGIRPVYSEARALIGLEDLEALRPIAALAEEFLTKNQSVNSSPRMQAINYLFLGIYFLLQKKLHESLEMLNQAAVLFEQHESRLDLAFTLERRAQTHILLDNIKNARQDLERAIEIFAACDAARHLARARKLYRTIYA